jgi:hypothetical protein
MKQFVWYKLPIAWQACPAPVTFSPQVWQIPEKEKTVQTSVEGGEEVRCKK